MFAVNDGSFVVLKELLKHCGGEAFLGIARASLRRGCLLWLRGGGLREGLSHAVRGDEIIESSQLTTTSRKKVSRPAFLIQFKSPYSAQTPYRKEMGILENFHKGKNSSLDQTTMVDMICAMKPQWLDRLSPGFSRQSGCRRQGGRQCTILELAL